MVTAEDIDLLQSYLDGRLSAEQEASLEARLHSEPALAEALLCLAREEAVLTEWAQAAGAVGQPEAAGPSRGRSRWVRIAMVGGAAAALAALVLSLVPPWERTVPVALAVLDEVQGEVYVINSGGSIPARVGQQLPAGHGIRTTGEGSFAAVAYPDTTRLELGADTEMRLLEPESSPGETGTKVFLEEGLVSGEVAQPERRPLVLATPHAEALVRARRFSFASAADATLAETEEGRLRLTRKSDGQAIDVPTGWYVLAAARAGPLKPRQLAARITRPRVTLNDAAGPILSLSYSPTGRLLTFGGWDGIVHEGDAATGQLRRTLQGHKKSVRALAYAPDGAWLATTSDEKGANVRLWELVSGEERATFKGHRAAVHTVAFSPDGKLLASGGAGGKEGGEVRLWHVPTGASAGLLRHGPGDVLALAFSPDGLQLATAGGKENLAKVWDLTTLQPICTLTGHTQRVQAAAFSPDGKVVATGSRDGSVRLWDAVSGEVLAVLVSDARDTRALAFSPDGKRLAVTNGPLARLWDVAGRRELVTFKAHKHAVTAVRFSPDGKTLATAGWDRTVRLWDIPQSAGLPGEL